METTAKQLNIRLSKEDMRQLNKLIDKLGESTSQVVRRALNKLYDATFHDKQLLL